MKSYVQYYPLNNVEHVLTLVQIKDKQEMLKQKDKINSKITAIRERHTLSNKN